MTITQESAVDGAELVLSEVDGMPRELVWRRERWAVTDRPTRLLRDAAWEVPWVTHQPVLVVGWRFQARTAAGDVRVIDVMREGGGWVVMRAWA